MGLVSECGQPLGNPGQLFDHNVFAYCKNNPVNMYDSDGRDPNKTTFLDGFLAGLYSWVKPYETRYEVMCEDPSFYNFGNWISSGIFDTVKGAFAPEKQLSLDHWMDSAFTVTLIFPAMQGVSKAIPVMAPTRINPLADVTYSKDVILKCLM